MKHQSKLSIFVILIFLSTFTFAQNGTDLTVSADRPGVGTPPSVMPVNHFQIETGFLYEKSTVDNSTTKLFSYDQSLFRYGLLSFAELRLSGDFTKTKIGFAGTDTSFTGFGPINFGTKISILKGKGIIPATSLLVNVTLPKTGKKEYQTTNAAPSIYLLFQNSLTDKLSLGYNLGLEWDGVSDKPTTFYAVNLGYGITEKLSCYIENYGYLISGGNDFFVDGGFAYQLTDKLQLDLYGGIDTKGAKTDSQISAGISWLIPKSL
jgi:hypothetical protein